MQRRSSEHYGVGGRDCADGEEAARGREGLVARYAGMEKDRSQRGETDAARSGVAWMAASGARSSKAEVGLSDVSRVDVDCKGTLGDRNFVSSAGAAQKVTRKESASWASFRVRCAIRLGGANVSISPTRARRGATKRASSFMILQPSWRKRMACRTRSTSAETVVVAG